MNVSKFVVSLTSIIGKDKASSRPMVIMSKLNICLLTKYLIQYNDRKFVTNLMFLWTWYCDVIRVYLCCTLSKQSKCFLRWNLSHGLCISMFVSHYLFNLLSIAFTLHAINVVCNFIPFQMGKQNTRIDHRGMNWMTAN